MTCNITNGDVLQLSHYTFLPLIWVWVTEIVTVKLLSNPTRWCSETPSWFRNRLNHFSSNNQQQPATTSNCLKITVSSVTSSKIPPPRKKYEINMSDINYVLSLCSVIFNSPRIKLIYIEIEADFRSKCSIFAISNRPSAQSSCLIRNHLPIYGFWLFQDSYRIIKILEYQKFENFKFCKNFKVSFTSKRDLGPKMGIFRLKWKLSPSTDTLNSPKTVLELDF